MKTSKASWSKARTPHTGMPTSQTPEANVPPVLVTSGALPVTGMPLWLVVLLALVVLGSGLFARRLGSGARD